MPACSLLLQGNVNVLPYRQFFEHARSLHLDAHATLNPGIGPLSRDFDIVETNRARCRRIDSDDQFEQRALSRAIWTDQTVDFPTFDCHAHIGDSNQTAEAL